MGIVITDDYKKSGKYLSCYNDLIAWWVGEIRCLRTRNKNQVALKKRTIPMWKDYWKVWRQRFEQPPGGGGTLERKGQQLDKIMPAEVACD